MCYLRRSCVFVFFFFFNDTATTEIYTLSLHDALPISGPLDDPPAADVDQRRRQRRHLRSEEHTSELQSRVDISYAVFCLKKNKTTSAQHLLALRGGVSNALRFEPMQLPVARECLEVYCARSVQPVYNDEASPEIPALPLPAALSN